MISKDVTLYRHLYLGGSDIAAVLGKSRYKTSYELWAEKTQKVEPADLSKVEAVELGTDLEDFVAQKFSAKTGLKVRRAPKVYQHPDYPFMVAHVDRLVSETNEILECKTCGAAKAKEWENDIPIEYIYQVQWYLGILGKKSGWIACLIGGQKFDYKQITFDPKLFDLMVEKAVKFWDMVVNNIPPAVESSDNETIIDVFPTCTDEIVENENLNDLIAYRQEICMHIEEMKKEKDEIEAQLKEYIGDNLGVKTSKYEVIWKPQTSKRLDNGKLKQDYPEIFNDYIQESNYRVLRISNRKEL